MMPELGQIYRKIGRAGVVEKNTVVEGESFDYEKIYINGMFYNNRYRIFIGQKDKHSSAASGSIAGNF